MTDSMRIKLLRIDPNCILWIERLGKTLLDAAGGGYCVGLDILDIPEGATIHHIYYQQDMRCFVAAVEHESFEEVACGSIPPYFDDFAMTKRIHVVVGPDGVVRVPAVSKEKSPVPDSESWRDRPPLT